LYYAIKGNKQDCFDWLLKHRCDLKIIDKRGMGLIKFAIRHNRI
jgi:hypothetical protein